MNVNYKRNDTKNWRRAVNRSSPLVGSLAGVIIILVTVVSIAESMSPVVAVVAGVLLLEVGIWYAANPIFTNGRQYLALRNELDHLIECVRQLNRAATAPHTEDEIEHINAEMHESVDAMVKLAGSKARGNARAETGEAATDEREKQAAS
ncbi:MAG: hypothetical protein ACYTKC_15835 [Planctomycetota bacterium]|jgi:hypothetical protein